VLVDLVGFAVALVLIYALVRSFLELRRSPHDVFFVVLFMSSASFVLVALIEAAMALLATRYIAPAIPFGTIAISLVLWKFLSDYFPKSRFLVASCTTIVVLLVGAVSMMQVAQLPKTSMEAIAKQFPLEAHPYRAIVVAPDTAAQTLAFYERTTDRLYGFVRWPSPDIFDLRGYVKLWSDPSVVQTSLDKVTCLIPRGISELVLVRVGTPGTPLTANSNLDYPKADAFVEDLLARYRLLHRFEFSKSIHESATVYVLDLKSRKAAVSTALGCESGQGSVISLLRR